MPNSVEKKLPVSFEEHPDGIFYYRTLITILHLFRIHSYFQGLI